MEVCKECHQKFTCDAGDDNEDTGLCSWCFEAGLEAYEERKRERIARENEY